MDSSRAWESMRDNMKTSPTESSLLLGELS
jgi:hypothetical protein